MPRVICLWFPYWPVQRIRSAHPELRDRPVALFAESGQRLGLVAISSDLAPQGLRPGLPLGEARALLRTGGRGRGKRPAWLRHDAAADQRGLAELARRLQSFCPLVGLMPLGGVIPLGSVMSLSDGLAMDITGCGHLFGGEVLLAAAVKEQVERLGFAAVLGVADSLGAGWAVARHGSSDIAFVPAEDRARCLDPLPVEALRLSASCLTRLASVDLRTIGQVRPLPRAALPSRFGKELLLRLDQAWGEVPETFTPERLVEPVSAVWSSEDPLSDLSLLDRLWDRLLEQVLERLAPQQLGIRELRVLHRSEDRREVTLPLRLHRPAFDRRHLVELLDLQRDRQPLFPGIVFIRMEVTIPGRELPRQTTLFGDDRAPLGRVLTDWLDRLESRLGTEAVRCPVLVPDPQPEFALRFEPPLPDAGTLSLTAPPEASSRADRIGGRFRPLRLFRTPEPLLLKTVPTRRVLWKGAELRITGLDRPERIAAGWHRDRDVRRDYFRARTERGECLWIFRCAASGRWFVHGLFE